MPQDLFIELFPILHTFPPLTAYTLNTIPSVSVGREVAGLLAQAIGGDWLWFDNHLLTNNAVSPVQIDITLDLLRGQYPSILKTIESADEDTHYNLTPLTLANLTIQTHIADLERDIQIELEKQAVSIPNAKVLREAMFSGWNINDTPTLAITIRSQVAYHKPMHTIMLERQEKLKFYTGWRVMNRTNLKQIGTISGVSGVLAMHRNRLLATQTTPDMQKFLLDAPDTEAVFKVLIGTQEHEFIASALCPAVRVDDAEDWERFEIPSASLVKALRLTPATRANLVKTVSDVLKSHNLIGNAYNSRTHEAQFGHLEFMPNLTYGGAKVRVYNPKTLADDFMKGKVFRNHARFSHDPIKIAIINALEEPIDDFVEAMRRLLVREFGFTIEMIKERKLKVISNKNIESALKVVEKEEPHILLAFFNDNQSTDDSSDSYAQYLKSITLSKGIATHVIYKKIMNDPDMMPLVIMSVLGKSGNTPFALSEPLEYADYVVGLGFGRQTINKFDRVVALARIYESDGVFVRYLLDTLDLEPGENVPYILLQTLFPIEVFEKKRVLIHHDGAITSETRKLLKQWAKVLSAEFYIVEILREQVPRLYGLDKGVVQAQWGSLFLLNAQESFVISSIPSADSTAQPLYVRVPAKSLPVEPAVYSVLAWSLLNFGSTVTSPLPVTVQHADDMQEWMAKGILPKNKNGDVPFWL
jgi:hypothetical protein